MTSEQIVAFLLFAVAAAVTPGPSNIMLTAVGASTSMIRGLPCLLGVTLGMGFMMFAVAFGLGSLVLDNPTVLSVLNYVGAGYLLWLAWRIATAGQSEETTTQRPIGFFGAAAFQWVNPKSWLVSTSAAGAYLDTEAGNALLQSALFGGLFAFATLPSGLVWLVFGVAVQHTLRNERARRAFNITMALLLTGSVILILW